jgi:hypothetical protein
MYVSLLSHIRAARPDHLLHLIIRVQIIKFLFI